MHAVRENRIAESVGEMETDLNGQLPEGAIEKAASQGMFGVDAHISSDNDSSCCNCINAFCD